MNTDIRITINTVAEIFRNKALSMRIDTSQKVIDRKNSPVCL